MMKLQLPGRAREIVYPTRHDFFANRTIQISVAAFTTCIPIALCRMYLKDCAYDLFCRVINCSRHGITPRSPSSPELRRRPLGQNQLAYRAISLRLSHATTAATAAEESAKRQQDLEHVSAFRRIQPNDPHITPSSRFITFDQAQHDLGVESRNPWERDQYVDQIASFLPIKPTSQVNAERLQGSSRGKHKADKLFVNKLLKDKGLQTQDWRVAFFDLLRYSIPEKINESKDDVSLDYPPSLVPIDGSQTQDPRCSNEDHNAARRVISESHNYKSWRLAHHISPPVEWSEANLAVYVEALAYSQRTQTKVPWTDKPRMKWWTSIKDIVTAFDRVFYSTTSQKFLSVKACNTALRFFYEHGMMTKARALYIHMEDLKMNISTETFNILIRESASQGDLHSFTFLLNKMTRRGFKPNEMTWTLFLRVVDSSKVRAIVVRQMAQMNMLDSIKIRRIVATNMIHDEIVNHLSNGHDHHSFLAHMDSKYGVGWLSTSAGNRLLNEVAKRQSTAESLNLLYEMKQRGFMPDDVSINTLLVCCLPLDQHDLAFDTLAKFKKLYRLYPGPQTYETLFRHAWKRRLLNLSIVIWRTACIYGAVSGNMKIQVFRSLLLYTPELDRENEPVDLAELSNLNKYAKFRKFAGRFVIGLDRPGGATLSRAIDSLKLSPQRRIRKWAHKLLEISFRVARTCVLEGDLSQKLSEALTMDKSWAAERLYEKDDWRVMFPHAIKVEVRVHREPWYEQRLCFRQDEHQVNPAPRLLMRKKDLPKDPGRQTIRRLSWTLQTRMRKWRIQSLRRANLRVQVGEAFPSSRGRPSRRRSFRSRKEGLRPRK